MKELKLHIVAVLLVFICTTVYAQQPNWSVNPNQYVYSMTLTGKVIIDGVASVDENDIVAAFINDECRGVATVTYQKALDEYFLFLMIYSNDPTGIVSLKIYDASSDKEIEVTETFNFELNGIVGSVSEPYSFSVQTKVYEAKILSFSVSNQVGGTSIGTNTIKLTVPADAYLSDLKPQFTLSEGAKVYVNGKEQVSGTSVQDFRSSKKYMVSPQVGADRTYTVTVTKATDNSTKISLSNTTVNENEDSVLVGTLSVQSDILGNNYNLFLHASSGAENQFFYLKDNKLYAKESFNYEVKSQYKVNLKVDDGNVSKQQLFTIDVLDQNDPPTNIGLSTRVLSETTGLNKLVAKLTANDEDLNDVHEYKLKVGDGVNDVGNSFFSITNDSLQLVNELSFQQDSLSILVEAMDSSGASIEKVWKFAMVDINFAPEIVSTPLNYAIQNQVYVYPVQVEDNEGDVLTCNFEGLPSWLTFNEETMLISGVPNNEHVGLVQFVLKVSDGHKEVSQAIIISVLNVNDAPEIKSYPSTQYFRTGKENTINLPEDCIVDPDEGDVLIFSLSTDNNATLPSWLNFDPATLTLSGSPTEDELGKYSLKLSAIDKGRLKEWVVFTLEVTLPTAIEANSLADKFKVYPNPVQSELYIGIPNGEAADVSLRTIQGKLLKKFSLNGETLFPVSVKDLSPGIYFVKFHQGNKVYVEQIIKQ